MKIIFKNARQRAKELERKFMKIENRGYKKRSGGMRVVNSIKNLKFKLHIAYGGLCENCFTKKSKNHFRKCECKGREKGKIMINKNFTFTF